MVQFFNYYSKLERHLKTLNRALDLDYKNLSDKYENLKLSHNRKKKALECLLFYFTVEPDISEVNEFGGTVTVRTGKYISPDDTKAICKFIKNALFCDGRVKSKCERSKK